MADHGVLLVGRDGIVRHAGEIIVGGVVLAHMREAEAPILPLASAALGGAVDARQPAADLVADRLRGLARLVAGRPDPDPIEEGRVEVHRGSIMRASAPRAKVLTKPNLATPSSGQPKR